MESLDPIRRASERRFPAWTLYARAFSGNRDVADDLVRRAVRRTLEAIDEPETVDEAHRRVLSAIRSSALNQPARPRTKSVLELLRRGSEDREARACDRAMQRKLRELPRRRRRALEQLILRRPSATLEKVIRSSRLDRRAFEARVERDLLRLAAVVRPEASPWQELPEGGQHPRLDELLAYIRGALSGDEAHAVMAHSGDCTRCGDRLGTMMWLKSQSVRTAQLPRLSRGAKKTAAVLLTGLALTAVGITYQHFAPNPWAEHATRETVPPWFHQFFYGGDKADAEDDLSQGLALLTENRYEEAIQRLEPLTEGAKPNTEAAAYLGIARYLTEDYSRGTLRLLEEGTSSTRAGRLARWYLANLHLARRNLGRARSELNALASIRDWFGRAAENLLDELERAETAPREEPDESKKA